jgi:hypothetical protein
MFLLLLFSVLAALSLIYMFLLTDDKMTKGNNSEVPVLDNRYSFDFDDELENLEEQGRDDLQ